jgi:hypothetical protein
MIGSLYKQDSYLFHYLVPTGTYGTDASSLSPSLSTIASDRLPFSDHVCPYVRTSDILGHFQTFQFQSFAEQSESTQRRGP